MESLRRFIAVASTVIITGYSLAYLSKSAWFRKKFMRRNEIEELEAIDRISSDNIQRENMRSCDVKTEVAIFAIVEVFTSGMGLFLLFLSMMVYFENSQSILLSCSLVLLAIIFLIYGIYVLFLEAIRIQSSPETIRIKKLFFKPYIINSSDINKVIFYWGLSQIAAKKYFAVDIFLKNARKCHFRIQAMAAKDTEKLLNYFRSNFHTEQEKRLYL